MAKSNQYKSPADARQKQRTSEVLTGQQQAQASPANRERLNAIFKVGKQKGMWSESNEMLAFMTKSLSIAVTPETVGELTLDLLDMVEAEMAAPAF